MFLQRCAPPLLRMLLYMACGLMLANILEALRWTEALARWVRPLSRAAHLSTPAASAFALAFVSPTAANALLAEKHSSGDIPLGELMLANLFNGLPSYLAHTPTIFFLTWPVLGSAALIYVGITLLAAVGRTAVTIFLGHLLLPPTAPINATPIRPEASGAERWREAGANAWRRFRRRLPKLVLFTVPVYILMAAGQYYGIFHQLEGWLAEHLHWLSFLKPQAMGIITMQLFAELGASLGAASAALADGALTSRDVVIAMLAGNVLATPLRAIRHQLPSYAGFYRPGIATLLVLANQSLRAASMVAAIGLYALFSG